VPLNLSFTHIMVVFVVALIVLGPDKLPDAARTLARHIGELRKMTSGLKAEVKETFGEYIDPIRDLRTTIAGGVAMATAAPGLQELPSLPEPAPPPVPAGPPIEMPSLAPASPFVAPGPTFAPLPVSELPALDGAEVAPGTFAAGPDGHR